MFNESIIVSTCNSVNLINDKSTIEIGLEIIKSQWVMILFAFVLLPLIIMLIFRNKLLETRNLKKSEISDNILLLWFISTIIIIFSYVFFSSYDFNILNIFVDIINKIR